MLTEQQKTIILNHLTEAMQDMEDDRKHKTLLETIRSEVGFYEQREGRIAMCKHLLMGLDMNIEYMNGAIAEMLGVEYDDQDAIDAYWNEAAKIAATL